MSRATLAFLAVLFAIVVSVPSGTFRARLTHHEVPLRKSALQNEVPEDMVIGLLANRQKLQQKIEPVGNHNEYNMDDENEPTLDSEMFEDHMYSLPKDSYEHEDEYDYDHDSEYADHEELHVAGLSTESEQNDQKSRFSVEEVPEISEDHKEFSPDGSNDVDHELERDELAQMEDPVVAGQSAEKEEANHMSMSSAHVQDFEDEEYDEDLDADNSFGIDAGDDLTVQGQALVINKIEENDAAEPSDKVNTELISEGEEEAEVPTASRLNEITDVETDNESVHEEENLDSDEDAEADDISHTFSEYLSGKSSKPLEFDNEEDEDEELEDDSLHWMDHLQVEGQSSATDSSSSLHEEHESLNGGEHFDFEDYEEDFEPSELLDDVSMRLESAADESGEESADFTGAEDDEDFIDFVGHQSDNEEDQEEEEQGARKLGNDLGSSTTDPKLNMHVDGLSHEQKKSEPEPRSEDLLEAERQFDEEEREAKAGSEWDTSLEDEANLEDIQRQETENRSDKDKALDGENAVQGFSVVDDHVQKNSTESPASSTQKDDSEKTERILKANNNDKDSEQEDFDGGDVELSSQAKEYVDLPASNNSKDGDTSETDMDFSEMVTEDLEGTTDRTEEYEDEEEDEDEVNESRFYVDDSSNVGKDKDTMKSSEDEKVTGLSTSESSGSNVEETEHQRPATGSDEFDGNDNFDMVRQDGLFDEGGDYQSDTSSELEDMEENYGLHEVSRDFDSAALDSEDDNNVEGMSVVEMDQETENVPNESSESDSSLEYTTRNEDDEGDEEHDGDDIAENTGESILSKVSSAFGRLLNEAAESDDDDYELESADREFADLPYEDSHDNIATRQSEEDMGDESERYEIENDNNGPHVDGYSDKDEELEFGMDSHSRDVLYDTLKSINV